MLASLPEDQSAGINGAEGQQQLVDYETPRPILNGDPAFLYAGSIAPDLEKRFYTLVRLVEDIERKTTLLLVWLRRYPYFKTPCCNAPMCFKCKTSDWHDGESCEQRMREGLGAPKGGVQWCPKCGVPTVKSEGCNHIVCVCGASWEWLSSSVLYACIHGMADRLQDALEAQTSREVRLKFTTRKQLANLQRHMASNTFRLMRPFNITPEVRTATRKSIFDLEREIDPANAPSGKDNEESPADDDADAGLAAGASFALDDTRIPVRTELVRVVTAPDARALRSVSTEDKEKEPLSRRDRGSIVRKLDEVIELQLPVEIWFRTPAANPNADDNADNDNADEGSGSIDADAPAQRPSNVPALPVGQGDDALQQYLDANNETAHTGEFPPYSVRTPADPPTHRSTDVQTPKPIPAELEIDTEQPGAASGGTLSNDEDREHGTGSGGTLSNDEDREHQEAM